MREFRQERIVIGLLLAELITTPLLAQSSSSFKWTYRKILLTPSLDTIRLNMPDLPEGAEYVIGVKSAANAISQAQFVVGAVHFGANRGSLRLISSIDNWPASQIKTAAGQIEVSGVVTGGPALLVYGQVDAGTTVDIEGPSGTIASGVIKSDGSLLVYDGNLVSQRVLGVRSLVPYLLHMHTNSTAENSQAGIVALPDGRYFANPAVLASHLISFTRPFYPAGETPPKFASGRLLVEIGIDGSVQSVRQVSGDRAGLAACETAVLTWRFKPFAFNGQLVTVNAPIVFFFTQNGKVTSPIFDELGR
jgi:hypothetical protein